MACLFKATVPPDWTDLSMVHVQYELSLHCIRHWTLDTGHWTLDSTTWEKKKVITLQSIHDLDRGKK